jgi:hypothetical protein
MFCSQYGSIDGTCEIPSTLSRARSFCRALLVWWRSGGRRDETVGGGTKLLAPRSFVPYIRRQHTPWRRGKMNRRRGWPRAHPPTRSAHGRRRGRHKCVVVLVGGASLLTILVILVSWSGASVLLHMETERAASDSGVLLSSPTKRMVSMTTHHTAHKRGVVVVGTVDPANQATPAALDYKIPLPGRSLVECTISTRRWLDCQETKHQMVRVVVLWVSMACYRSRCHGAP